MEARLAAGDVAAETIARNLEVLPLLHLTDSVYKVVPQKSILAQTHQLILYISSNKG
jgi:hypothetical protein